jgi:ankyrin repeat protein
MKYVGHFLFVLLLLVAPGNASTSNKQELDESRVDELGWTDAHQIAYAFGDTVLRVEWLELELASSDYLCLQNDYGQTALHLAVRQNNVKVVELYATRRICLDVANKDGDTPLHYAAAWSRFEATRLLLDAGANPNSPNKNGLFPLDDAVAGRYSRIVALLQDVSKGEVVKVAHRETY